MKKHIKLFILYTLIFTFFVQPLSFADELKTVSFDKLWTITFNRNIDKSSINNNSIYVYDSNYKKLSTNISIGDTGNTIIISPEDNYLPNSTYNIFVSKSVRSVNNKNIKDDYIYKFKTEKLSESNLSTFSKTLDSLTVSINYISDNNTVSTKGLLTYDNKLNKAIVASYYNKDTNADNVEIYYKNNKLSGKIHSYDDTSNLIIYTIDDIDVTSMINISSSDDYEYIYNFETIFNKADVFSETSSTPTILINSDGKVVGLTKENSSKDENKIFFKDINLENKLSLPFSSIDNLFINLKAPSISGIKYNTEKEIITLDINKTEEYILYFSIDNENYKSVNDSNGYKQIFSDSTVDIKLSTLNLSNIPDSSELFFKASSYKSQRESDLSENMSVKINKLSEEEIAKKIVMNGIITQFEKKTIGQAFNDYFSSYTWTYIKNTPSPEIKFEGHGIYKNSYHEITFLFSVNVASESFRLENVKVDNTPLNFSEIPYLLQTIYN